MDEWKPIDTVPKDGSRFLVALPSGHVGMAFLDCDTIVGYDYSLPWLELGMLTGWMPLPKAPTA